MLYTARANLCVQTHSHTLIYDVYTCAFTRSRAPLNIYAGTAGDAEEAGRERAIGEAVAGEAGADGSGSGGAGNEKIELTETQRKSML